MRFGLSFGLVLTAAMAMSGAVNAESVRRVVKGGQRTMVANFSIYSTFTCQAGPLAEAKITTQPQSGKLEVVPVKYRIKAGNCGAMEVWGIQVFYTPNRGHRGADRVGVEFLYNSDVSTARMTSRDYTVNITVN